MQPHPNPSHYGSKRCRRCQLSKPLAAFHVKTASVDGRQSYCAQCDSEIGRENTWRREYGLQPGRVRRCLEIQHERCPSCNMPIEWEIVPRYARSFELTIDTDPDTGEIRGLLHRRCHERNPKRLRNWQNYLRNPPMRQAYDNIPHYKPGSINSSVQDELFTLPPAPDVVPKRNPAHPKPQRIT